jgi:hypothetical protein
VSEKSATDTLQPDTGATFRWDNDLIELILRADDIFKWNRWRPAFLVIAASLTDLPAFVNLLAPLPDLEYVSAQRGDIKLAAGVFSQ